MLDNCPKCKVSLLGDVIPPEARHWHGGSTHYRREFGVEIRGVYDGVLYWECPDCSYAWPRFPPGHRLYGEAVRIIKGLPSQQ